MLDERRIETVEPGGHGRMGGEKVSCAGGGQRDVKGLIGFFHETQGPLQHGKGGMPFIQVTDFRLDAESIEQAPSPDPEKQFLLQAHFHPSPVQLSGDSPMGRSVRCVIGIQQIQLRPADPDLPGAQPYGISGQGDLNPQPFAVWKE